MFRCESGVAPFVGAKSNANRLSRSKLLWLDNCSYSSVMRTSSDRRARLEDLRASLIAEQIKVLANGRSQLQMLTTPQNTAAEDQVALLHDQFLAIDMTSRNQEKLASIQSALNRLSRGEFGICGGCEDEIPLKRLQAIPWATYCVPCQEQVESANFADRGAAEHMSSTPRIGIAPAGDAWRPTPVLFRRCDPHPIRR